MNALAGLRVQEAGLGEWMRYTRADGYDLYLDRRHPGWVRELDSEFEIVWSSLWQSRAPDPFGVVAGFGVTWRWIDFDRFNRNPLDHEPYRGRTSNAVARIKMGAIIETIGDRPAVIMDDDFEFLERDWAVQRTEDGIPTLVISPDYETGLERAHVDLAMAFAAKLHEGQSSVPTSTGGR